MEREIAGTLVRLKQGDLTLETVDVIVNAANPSLLGGGGVDGAIHQRGGPAILKACKAIVAAQGPLPTGQAVITPGGNLDAGFVIHTVGPIYSGDDPEEERLLGACYQNCLRLAIAEGLRSVAFPSISTGAYGYPVHQAAPVALRSVAAFLYKKNENQSGKPCLDRVVFCLFSAEDYHIYADFFQSMK
ncbi:MAG: O-acetyl-ADP-ribose deacetylase [Planctomycetes bacterium]|nr:O-acetyl-ADP-ribose deacetylase [Planctomycetota bacterium]